jgi:hypothetical protein
MKIYTKVFGQWCEQSKRYVVLGEESYEYAGQIDKLCGASSGQKTIASNETDLFKQIKEQGSAIFGNASNVFKDLMGTFAPTVAAGPNQMGFSAPELANLNSSAITNTGVATRNALQASKEASAAVGGGNMALPSGADIGRSLSVANAGAAETSKELSDINAKNYEVGRENYYKAAEGLAGATNVFNPSTSASNAATTAGEAAANTENQIASANNSWQGAVAGALGGIAGNVVSGGMTNLSKGIGFFGQNAPAPTQG